MGVTGIVVTRGDQDIEPVTQSIKPHVDQLVVWDNSKLFDRGVYGRYMGSILALHQTVYVQDDDCIVSDIPAILAAYQEGSVVCNMPEKFRKHYPDSALVGFGACYQKWLPFQAFDRYFALHGIDDKDERFRRTCDVVFTTLTPRILVDVSHVDMWYASGPNRMWKQPDHYGERTEVHRLARKVRP